MPIKPLGFDATLPGFIPADDGSLLASINAANLTGVVPELNGGTGQDNTTIGTGLVTRTAANNYVARSLIAGNGITITNPAGIAGNPTISANFTQLITEIWIGAALNPAITPTGSAIAPFADYTTAMAYISGRAEEYFVVHLAPGLSGNLTVPADKGILFDCSDLGGASINALVINGSADSNHQILLRGISTINTIDFAGTGTAILGILDFCTVTSTITNTGGIAATLISGGASDLVANDMIVTFLGAISLGTSGTLQAYHTDCQANVTATTISFANSKIPALLTCNGTAVSLSECVCNATPTVVFSGAAGVVTFDSASVVSYGLAGGQIVNGIVTNPVDGPQLLYCGTITAFDAAQCLSNGGATLVTGDNSNNDKTTFVCYPATTGPYGLFWPDGTSIPASPGLAISWYRDINGNITSSVADGMQLIGTSDDYRFFVNIRNVGVSSSTTITIASLSPSGIWYSGEFVGPTCGDTSSFDITGPNGIGFFCVPYDGVLKNFKMINASSPGTTMTFQLWYSPGANLAILVFTGITITMIAGDSLAENNIDTFAVGTNDLLLWYNPELIGYTSNTMMITGDLYATLT